MIDRRNFIKQSALLTAGIGFLREATSATDIDLRIGIIGLDTSHSTAFTKIIQDTANPVMAGARVVCAFPFGSKRIETSAGRIAQYSKEMQTLGVKLSNSIDELIASVDAVMLLTNDGALHLEQIIPVLNAKKRVFLDKPIGANLREVLKIYKAVELSGVPMFSSSALRYLDGAQKVRYENAVGQVIGAEAYSPQKTEPSHTDLFWYGIHGVEILFTMMGKGCVKVKRITSTHQDVIVGEWNDGRIGSYKGDLQARQFYGGTAYGTDGVLQVGPFAGYQALTEKIIQFFRDGISPVDPLETLEIYTFMEAADASRKQNGEWTMLQDVLNNAKK
jgi:predicted dehydrogenase